MFRSLLHSKIDPQIKIPTLKRFTTEVQIVSATSTKLFSRLSKRQASHKDLKIWLIQDPDEKNSSAQVQRLSGNRFCRAKAAGNVIGKAFVMSAANTPPTLEVIGWVAGRLTHLLEREGGRKVEGLPLGLFACNDCTSETGAARALLPLCAMLPLLGSLSNDSLSLEVKLMLIAFLGNRRGFFGDGKNISGKDLWRVRPRVVVFPESGSDPILSFDLVLIDMSSSSVLSSSAGDGGTGFVSCREVFKKARSMSMLSSCWITSRLRSLP